MVVQQMNAVKVSDSTPSTSQTGSLAMGDPAHKLWQNACGTLLAPTTEESWKVIIKHSPPDTVWHSVNNCIAHQAGVWTEMLATGTDDVIQPAAFKLAIVLRHTPSELVVQLLAELLHLHPQSQDLTSYVLALLTDDESGCACLPSSPASPMGPPPPVSPAPLRDLQLFGDCELAVLAAPHPQYDAHAKLVRAEYAKLSHGNYVELRIKVLNQFCQIPKLFHTPEFSVLEKTARDNIDREIGNLREELLTFQTK